MTIVVFLDTNVLYHSLDYSIQIQEAVKQVILGNYEIYIHTMVENEILNALVGDGKLARQAKFAVELMKQFERYEDPREYPGADIALHHSARRVKGVVFTFDKKLRDLCLTSGIPVISHHKKGNIKLYGYLE